MTAIAVVPNIALGRLNEWALRVNSNDPANAVWVTKLYQIGDSAANLRDFDTAAAVEAGAAAESTFTNYAEVVLDDGDVDGPTVDHTGDEQTWEYPDQTPAISSAGGASDEDIDMIGLFYDSDSTGGDDSNLLPAHFTIDDGAAALTTTNGSDLDITSPSPTWAGSDAS